MTTLKNIPEATNWSDTRIGFNGLSSSCIRKKTILGFAGFKKLGGLETFHFTPRCIVLLQCCSYLNGRKWWQVSYWGLFGICEISSLIWSGFFDFGVVFPGLDALSSTWTDIICKGEIKVKGTLQI